MDVNSLTFGNVNTADYGVYISGEAAFNAPGHVYDVYDVPGRNGRIIVDQGQYENIEVTYPAFIFDYDKANFASRMAEIRSAFLAQTGYIRLSDTYNPGEFRMAYYAGGFEVEPQHFNQTGEFELVFNCKPQRWLTAGEETITVEDGDVITNPTLFDSSPMLEVEGYGAIEFNEHKIILNDITLVNISLLDKPVSFEGASGEVVFSEEFVNNGDLIKVGVSFKERLLTLASSILSRTYTQPTSGTVKATSLDTATATMFIETNDQIFSFNAGTDSTQTDTAQVVMTYQRLGIVTTYNCTIDITYNFEYNAANSKLKYKTLYSITCHSDGFMPDFETNNPSGGTFRSIDAISSISILEHPTYIDCELGEAYLIENDQFLSLNPYIDLGSNLPTLAPGANTVTFDNTIEDLKIVPKWWVI